jgi:biopolymer transport protein ExbD
MFKDTRTSQTAKLSIAPLLDMIFILLIFFVVSTTFSKLPGVNIQRPEASAPDRLPTTNTLIGITPDGNFYINKQRYTESSLKSYLLNAFRNNPELTVLIMADRQSAIKFTITAMDICKQVGINSIAIAEEITK